MFNGVEIIAYLQNYPAHPPYLTRHLYTILIVYNGCKWHKIKNFRKTFRPGAVAALIGGLLRLKFEIVRRQRRDEFEMRIVANIITSDAGCNVFRSPHNRN